MDYEKLEQIRKSKGLTHEDMALALGYKDKSSYCLIENGKTGITVNLAKKIKAILKLTNKEFMSIFFKEDVEVIQTSNVV